MVQGAGPHPMYQICVSPPWSSKAQKLREGGVQESVQACFAHVCRNSMGEDFDRFK